MITVMVTVIGMSQVSEARDQDIPSHLKYIKTEPRYIARDREFMRCSGS